MRYTVDNAIKNIILYGQCGDFANYKAGKIKQNLGQNFIQLFFKVLEPK